MLEADGTEALWDGADLRARIAFASIGLELALDATTIERELRRSIRPGVLRADLQRLVVLNAKSLVERDSDFSLVRGTDPAHLHLRGDARLGHRPRRHRRAAGGAPPGAARRRSSAASRSSRIDPALLDYDLDRLGGGARPDLRPGLRLLGLQTLYDRYLIVDKTGDAPRRIEAPQLFWMRVAMGVCLGEEREGREAHVLDLYRVYKERRFCSSTPTLFNAGTQHSQLSSLLTSTTSRTR